MLTPPLQALRAVTLIEAAHDGQHRQWASTEIAAPQLPQTCVAGDDAGAACRRCPNAGAPAQVEAGIFHLATGR